MSTTGAFRLDSGRNSGSYGDGAGVTAFPSPGRL